MGATGLENESADFFRKILGESDVPIVITDALALDHPVVFVNDAFVRCTGYSAAESIGRDGRHLHDGNFGVSRECVSRSYRKDGTSFWNHLHVYPIRNDDNVVTHLVGVHRDVTTTHETVQDLFKSRIDADIQKSFGATTPAASRSAREIPGRNDYRQDAVRPQDRLDHRTPGAEPPDDPHRHTAGQAVAHELRRLDDDADAAAIAVGRDIPDKSPAMGTDQLTHDKLNAVLNSITEGCLALDHGWRLTYINDQAARWLGRRREDLLGKNVWDELPEAVGGTPYQTYHRAMATRAYAQCDHYYPPVGRWLNARAYPSEEGLTIFFLDVSERKRNEDRMTYAASHDHLTGLMNRENLSDETGAYAPQRRSAPWRACRPVRRPRPVQGDQ